MHGNPFYIHFIYSISKIITTNLHIGFRGKETTTMAPYIYMICPDHRVIKVLNQYSDPGLSLY